MPKFLDNLRAWGKKLETPFAIQQVETHLFFGPLGRHLPVAYLVMLAGVGQVVWSIFFSKAPISFGQRLGEIIDTVIFQIIALPLILLCMTKRQQAILAWTSVKISLAIAFLIMIVFSMGALLKGDRNALPTLFLGFIWLPSLEFVPKITPHQKYVTIARLLLSIPCVYFGVRSGDWHWS